MDNLLISLVKKPFKRYSNGVLLLICYLIVLPYLIGYYLGDNSIERIKICLYTFIIIVFITEILFRFFYRLYFGESYIFNKKIPIDKLYVEPHPYLPYIYKKHFRGPSPEKLNYPLHPDLYSADLTTNNYRFNNGPNGDRNIVLPKPKNLVRINCIGASTTGNYIGIDNNNYSYPLELEKILRSKFNGNLEVNNCGMGGYNSADILIRFLLQTIDTDPDYIIIYHAYNDIESYLTPGFYSDYSHSRRSLGEVYWKFIVGTKIPDIPLKFINCIKNQWFPGFNVRYSLLRMVSKGTIDPTKDFSKGLKTYQRNLQNIINVCLMEGISVTLCTYCHYMHEKIKEDPLHLLYNKIVLQENEIMKKLAIKNNLKLVDCYSLVPREDSNFVDSIHFTPKGMNLLAKCISDIIDIK
jgi:lysophospholipase L1-like esterase